MSRPEIAALVAQFAVSRHQTKDNETVVAVFVVVIAVPLHRLMTNKKTHMIIYEKGSASTLKNMLRYFISGVKTTINK